MIGDVKVYGRKSLWSRLTTRRKGWVSLSVADEIKNQRFNF